MPFVAVVWWHIDTGYTSVADTVAIKEDNYFVLDYFLHSPKPFLVTAKVILIPSNARNAFLNITDYRSPIL